MKNDECARGDIAMREGRSDKIEMKMKICEKPAAA